MILAFQSSDFAHSFLSLFLEGAPFILLGTLISGFIDVYMPSSLMDRLLPKNKLLAILSCGLLGLILPVCECAVVPVIRRLVAKGLPVSCAFTYMLAAPILNPITMWSTWNAFDGQEQMWFTLSRAGMGYLTAVLVGIIIMWIPIERIIRDSLLKTIRSTGSTAPKDTKKDHHHDHDHTCCGHDHDKHEHSNEHSHSCDHDHSHDHQHRNPNKVVAALRAGLRDSVDVGVYFTIGVCLAALFNILYNIHSQEAFFTSLLGSTTSQTATMMLLAFLLSVCSTSDAFLAATYNFVGASAKMSFLVIGPMLDVKLLFLYQTVMKKRFLAYFCLILFLLIGILCWSWETYEIGKDSAIWLEQLFSGKEAK